MSGTLVALSLAMSLETLPLLAALCGGMVLLWVWRGAPLAASLAEFGIGLGLGLIVCFLVTVPPDHWLMATTDAFGAPHAGAGLIGAGAAILMARASDRLHDIKRRSLAALVAGVCVLLFLALCYPAVLRSPFADVDPLVRAVWLDHVAESKPLLVFMRTHPMTGLMVAAPAILGLAGAVLAACRLSGLASLRFTLVALLAAVGIGLGFWQLRVFASVTPLALCGALYIVERVRENLRARDLALAAAFAPMAVLPFTSTTWAIALPGDPATPHDSADCLAPASVAPLAALPPGRAIAPLDSGPYLLEATALDVFSAPYHRNNDGNRFALDVWRAAPDAARTLLASRGVGYVVTCAGMGDLRRIAEMAPGGLAARLSAGAIPAYLTPNTVSGTPYRVFAVERGR